MRACAVQEEKKAATRANFAHITALREAARARAAAAAAERGASLHCSNGGPYYTAR